MPPRCLCEGERRDPAPICRLAARALIYLAKDEDLTLQVEVDGLRVVEEVPQHLCVVRRDPQDVLCSSLVEDQLVGELAGLSSLLGAPVGVDVGHLPNLDRLLGMLLLPILFAHGNLLDSPNAFVPTRPRGKLSRRGGPGPLGPLVHSAASFRGLETGWG